ncbi:MAG: hypothetical protein AAGI11_13370 [Pseudomonadota bacterium]
MNEQAATNNGRMVLLLIFGLPITMILAASWLWFFVERGNLDLVGALGTHNSGSLLRPPRQLDEQRIRDADGREFRYSDMEPRWSLLVANAGADCDATCERSLYLIRQIHTAIGKEYSRLRRVYIGDHAINNTALDVEALSDESEAPEALADYLATEQRGLKSLQVSPEAYATLFAEQQSAADTWYLVDPSGWVMMTYDHSISYKDVISDLKFLLKNSSG